MCGFFFAKIYLVAFLVFTSGALSREVISSSELQSYRSTIKGGRYKLFLTEAISSWYQNFTLVSAIREQIQKSGAYRLFSFAFPLLDTNKLQVAFILVTAELTFVCHVNGMSLERWY